MINDVVLAQKFLPVAQRYGQQELQLVVVIVGKKMFGFIAVLNSLKSSNLNSVDMEFLYPPAGPKTC